MLRPATTADIPVIHALAHRIWWAHYPDIIGAAQVEYMLGRNYSPDSLGRQMADGQVFWLLEQAGMLVGYIAVSRQEPGLYFIHKFYLDNGQRGRGIGKTAFALVLEQYPDLKEVRLTVNRQNYKSINFYFKIGFVIAQCVDIAIGEGYVMRDFEMVWRRGEQENTTSHH